MNEIRNPQHEPGAEKRPIIVFAVVMALLLFTQFFIAKFYPQRQNTPATTDSSKAPEQKNETRPPSQPAAPQAQAKAAPAATPAVPAGGSVIQKQAASESETVVENDLIRVVFSNKGAVIKHWILKKHLSDDRKSQLDMVNQRAADALGYPMSLFTWDEDLGKKLNAALFVPSASGELKAPAEITFEYSDGDVSAKKTFKFDGGYVVHVSTGVTQRGNFVQTFPQWPSGLGDQLNGSGFGYASTRIDWQTSEKIERHAAQEGFIFKSHVSHGANVSGPFNWAGIVDQFFAAVFLPDNPTAVKMVQLHGAIARDPKADEEKQKKERFSVLGAAVGNPDAPTSLRLFIGPKDLDVLQRVHSTNPDGTANGNIEGVVDFGFFGIIAKPLFLWLRWMHQHIVPNWGWAIILITIAINLALFPLRYTAMKSGLMQQKIKPELDAINRRYQGLKLTDPRQQEKQREVQAVMKREGIHPMSGCVPTLIQLPFLWAFYTMLSAVNELRHAPWLWVNDLSAPDRFYILPVLIVVTMYFSQKLTPMPQMDAAQVKMMQVMMPIMIGFISINLAAGLSVYWFAGNLIAIATQYMMNNSKMAREIREHVAKREMKKGKR